MSGLTVLDGTALTTLGDHEVSLLSQIREYANTRY